MIKKLLLGKNWWSIKLEFIAHFHTENSCEEIEKVCQNLYNTFDAQGLALTFDRPTELFKVQVDDKTHYQSTFQIRLFSVGSTNPFKLHRTFNKLLTELNGNLKIKLTRSSIALTKTSRKTSNFTGGDPSDFEF